MKKLNEISVGTANGYSLKKGAKQETLRMLKLALLDWEMTRDTFTDDAEDYPEYIEEIDQSQRKIAADIKRTEIIPAFMYGKKNLMHAADEQELSYGSIISAVLEIEAKEGEEKRKLQNNFINKYLAGDKIGYAAFVVECGNVNEKVENNDDLSMINAFADVMAENNYKRYQTKRQDDMVTRVIADNHLGV